MTILTKRVVWRKHREPLPHGRRTGARIDRLSPEQEANVRAWLRVMHAQHGTWRRVAEALGISLKNVECVLAGSRRPTPGWALRVAEAMGTSVDAVLGSPKR